MNPAPTRESLAACYPTGYSQHREPEAEVESSGPTRQPWYLSRFVRAVPGPRWAYHKLMDTKAQPLPPIAGAGHRALEIGCATGDFLVQLIKGGWDAQGLELVPAAAEIAAGRGLDITVGSFNVGCFDAESFDAVFAWMVVEHLPDPRGAIDEVLRLLKPGGWFCLSVPNYGSWERRLWARHWKGIDLPRHLQHFTTPVIKRLLQESGFERPEIIYQRNFLYWLGSQGSAMQSRWPDSRLGAKLTTWFYNSPPLWLHFLLGPLAHMLAWIGMTGRLSILVRKPQAIR